MFFFSELLLDEEIAINYNILDKLKYFLSHGLKFTTLVSIIIIYMMVLSEFTKIEQFRSKLSFY